MRRGGFDSFSFDITATLNASSTGVHEVIVDVWDPTEDADGVPVGKQRAHVWAPS